MPALRQLTNDAEMWQYFSLNLADDHSITTWMQIAIDEKNSGIRIPFLITDKRTNNIAGSTSIGNISMYDMRAEIGWTWLGKPFRGTEINLHAKFAMLRYLFDDEQFERVEFKTDMLNERAKNGLRKIGATEEGVFRSHMKMWNNRRRDSVYFSILKTEWPALKQTIFKELFNENY